MNIVLVQAANYIKLAPANAPAAWKATATAVLPGVADCQAIVPYLASGNIVEVGPGTVTDTGSNGFIYLNNKLNLTLFGQGAATVFNTGGFCITNSGKLRLGSFNMTGTIAADCYGSIFIGGDQNTDDILIHDIYSDQKKGQHFYIYANGADLSHTVLSRCISESSDAFGFLFSGEKPYATHSDVVLYRCRQHNAGASNQNNGWVTGFDCAEFGTDEATSTSQRFTVIKCESDGAFESTYHHEYAVNKKDFVYLDCDAKWAGLKPDNYANDNGTTGSQYGWGFLFGGFKDTDDLIASGLTGDHNKLGDMQHPNGQTYSPPIDLVWNSNKTVYRISQGNCTGIVVKNGIVWDLYLYSSDENPVSELIKMPDGTSFQANFTDFLVQRGVVGITINSGILSNGRVGMVYSQTLKASGGTPPLQWGLV